MLKKIIPYVLAVIMFLGAFGHIAAPEQYAPIIPGFIPANLAHIFAIIGELAAGILLVIPKYRKWGGFVFMDLMIIFLPLHVWDLLKDDPMMGSQMAAIIRLLVQFLFIYAGYWIWKNHD